MYNNLDDYIELNLIDSDLCLDDIDDPNQDNCLVDENGNEDFQNIMTGIRNCIYTPNIGSRFAENYKSSIYEGEVQEAPQPTQSESSEPVDYIEKLKEIKSLLDDGIITDEDFEKMKQKIIDNM